MQLELRDVVKHYRTPSEAVHAVDGVSLVVGAGEFVAIYGPSGSGKTTLLMLAAAIIEPDAGSIVVDGRKLAGLSTDDAARYRLREVGFVFQGFHLMAAASVLDNAALKLLLEGVAPAEARRRVEPWLERLGLGHRLDQTPSRLSAGERQRVAIARALSNEPKLLLADEPTGNLDTARGRAVLELMGELARERQMPILLVTHDPQAIEVVDRAHVLRDGRLTEPVDAAPALGDLLRP